jgi:integrase
LTKRANGEGTVRQRPNGRWEGRIVYTDPVSGVSRRQSFYGATAKAVRADMKAGRYRIDAGAPIKDSNTTVGAWLAQWIATTLAASDRKESTRELYGRLASKHLMPAPFGAIRLDRLKPFDVEALVLAMRAKTRTVAGSDGSERSVRCLSDSTIRTTYTVLRGALDGAVRDGLLARNSATAVKRPGVGRTEARSLAPVDVVALLDAAKGSRYHSALVLIATTGLRRGEALALRWEHVDLVAGSVNVRGTLGRVGGELKVTEPKSQRSRRTVRLTPAVVGVLKAHRKAQIGERLHAGSQWVETG